MLPPQPRPTLFPYTTLFRSSTRRPKDGETGGRGEGETACSTLKSHSIESSGNESHRIESHNIDASLKRRARLLITNSSIPRRSEEHTSELQSLAYLVCRLLL